jgi:hypothetical protein
MVVHYVELCTAAIGRALMAVSYDHDAHGSSAPPTSDSLTSAENRAAALQAGSGPELSRVVIGLEIRSALRQCHPR